ncbi:TIGR02530 family flagellar biosynthesis protein [Paenibacillus aquistagni]|uniref:Flagellar operon protein n=1 Tax=Paenibacillus aquistagni TaxID=1852522 RepID=A0A1X7IMU1_9BACL|nr:TIGR02530 family flagellar biosynthesis protein [Paenibacillus aquistagni]SMG16247.1 flagellar operon protein [Paenibacillus aquistagni]
MRTNFHLGGIRPQAPIQPAQPHKAAFKETASEAAAPFKQLLEREIKRSDSVQFSHHASKRIEERGMTLTPEVLKKINEAVDQAAAKGSKQSLVLMNNAAYIVNVPSRTIITALDKPFQQGHLFTAIDSAVCIE